MYPKLKPFLASDFSVPCAGLVPWRRARRTRWPLLWLRRYIQLPPAHTNKQKWVEPPPANWMTDRLRYACFWHAQGTRYLVTLVNPVLQAERYSSQELPSQGRGRMESYRLGTDRQIKWQKHPYSMSGVTTLESGQEEYAGEQWVQ